MESDLKDCHLCERSLNPTNFNAKRKECKECSKGLKLLYRYGITMKRYLELLEAQSGVCLICWRSPEKVGVLRVDHDHKCCPGEKTCGTCLRGLLCDGCNVSIGRMEDDYFRLIRAATYVLNYS